MIECLVDNVFVRSGGLIFRQTAAGIPIGTSWALLLVELLLYSYENEFFIKLIKDGNRRFTMSCTATLMT